MRIASEMAGAPPAALQRSERDTHTDNTSNRNDTPELSRLDAQADGGGALDHRCFFVFVFCFLFLVFLGCVVEVRFLWTPPSPCATHENKQTQPL